MARRTWTRARLYSLTLGAVTDPGTDTVTSYVVHWGDGNSSTYSPNGVKTHTYADGPNDRAVTVDLVDEDGTFLDRANALSVHVVNVAPTAHLSGDDEVNEGTTHTYTFTVTDPGTDTFTVNTPDYPDCGTGGDYVAGTLSTTASGGSFDCTFPDGPATTDVKIRVTDSDGASDTDTENVVVVNVANVDPVVTLTGPSPVAEGSTHTYSYTTTDDGTPETFSRDAQSCDGGTLSGATFSSVDRRRQLRLHLRRRAELAQPERDRLRRRRRLRLRLGRGHGHQRRPDDRDQRQRERERGLGLHADPGRGHRPGHRHRLQLRRPLGRRQRRHLRRERREDAHLRRRRLPTTAITVDLVDEDGTFLDRRTRSSVTSSTSPRRSRSAARPTSTRARPTR